jgi:hypothetical protein
MNQTGSFFLALNDHAITSRTRLLANAISWFAVIA